jgi:type II secretory ATPase GspE/PulE/Tfp pilus assembly ATPase PilB-like protein
MEAKLPGGVIALLNDIIEKAVSLDASDVHIEPNSNNIRVRYRIDGLLQNGVLIHRSMLPQIISRIKIMAELDISESRLPQDGRSFIKSSGKEFDLRVSTMPTIHGEKAVLRILDRKRSALKLDEIGMPATELNMYRKVIEKPNGMIIVCGPTGCGKTTTLYSSLDKINSESLNIITIEDPIEYQLAGINQIPVNIKTGLTFAKGLRSVLRQDPDVIMVGEIRDTETAATAVQAAMTGHLVFTTLHTNDAASAVTRLSDMGLEDYLINSTLKCVLSQRLVRKLCQECKGHGCRHCNHAGFKGRAGIFEMLDPKISDMPARSMMDNAKDLIRSGITTMEEVVRNVYVE